MGHIGSCAWIGCAQVSFCKRVVFENNLIYTGRGTCVTEQEEELKMKKVHAGYLRAASVSVTAAAVVLAGCASGGGDTQSGGKTGGEQTEILVAAAASLEYAFEEELIPLFEEAHPGVTVRGTYDSSGKLQTQIEEGMEADVFMSAARQQMDSLAEEGFVDGDSVADLLDNQIVLITPADNEAGLASFTDLTKADTIAVGDPASVPAGQYAREALTDLGLWDQVLAKASLGTNVTEVLNWVAEGSAQAGIVYATDAATTDRVKVIAPAPEGSLEEPAVYPAGLVADSAHPKEAQAFLKFLRSGEAVEVFESYGFTVHEEKE